MGNDNSTIFNSSKLALMLFMAKAAKAGIMEDLLSYRGKPMENHC
jgi:hypothetical protein